ncbi:MAG TPA: copper transporter [Streptosporangiaceae bacterium]|nr:copper transporter [Streptosporangiaceae bacterium]
MIDFRYHLVSIIAVFLALAIGIVVGSTALQPAVESSLHATETLLKRRIDQVTQNNTALTQGRAADQAFAQAAESRLLGHLLTGQDVVMVTAPSPNGQVVTGLTTALHTADATMTGTVALQPPFFDDSDSTEARLSQLAQQLAATAGLTISAQHDGDAVAGQEAAAQVIAAAIAAKTGPAALSPAQSQAILSGFASAGYLQVSGPGGTATNLPPAGLAIVVAPATPPSATDVSPANLALLAVAEQLQTASHGTVLAGSLAGSGPGSAIDEATGGGKLSTVDEADAATGQIMTVQALANLLSGRPPGSYGVHPGAAPSPAPTPSVTPTTTTTAPHVRNK